MKRRNCVEIPLMDALRAGPPLQVATAAIRRLRGLRNSTIGRAKAAGGDFACLAFDLA
jgi:hypothetical protein